MRAAMVVFVVACGPGLARPPSFNREAARDAMLDANGDAAALERLMSEKVVTGGLWFADPACANAFSGAGEIAPAQFHSFAGCLATLKLERSPRRDMLFDVTLLTYAPGVEIEARLGKKLDEPRLIWIGFASRRDDADNLPTMSAALFESLRTAGDPHPKTAGAAWLKVCLAADGSVASTTPFASSSREATQELTAAVATWTFKPSPIGAACSMAHFGGAANNQSLPGSPGTTDDPPFIVAPTDLHRRAGEKNIVPDDGTKIAISRSGIRHVVGAFKVCLDTTGAIESVTPLKSTGVAAYDQRILGTIRRDWSFEPYRDGDVPVRVCTAITFIYTQH